MAVNEAAFRKGLVELLEGGHAHVTPKRAPAGVASSKRGHRLSPRTTSIWEELEHLRLAQEDILNYTLDPEWKSPAFPDGYWPKPVKRVTDAAWKKSVNAFLADLGRIVALVKNTKIDLTSEIPHGEGRTYLRQVLLVADHNAYHLGQIVTMRKQLGDWKS